MTVLTLRPETGRLRLDVDYGDAELARLQGLIATALFVHQGQWFGEMLNDAPVGSRFHEMRNAPLDEGLAQRAEAEARRALKFLIDEGLARAIEVQAELKSEGLSLSITIIRPHGQPLTLEV